MKKLIEEAKLEFDKNWGRYFPKDYTEHAPIVPGDRKDIKQFITDWITKSYEAGQLNGIKGKFYTEFEVIESVPKKLILLISQKARDEERSRLLEEIEKLGRKKEKGENDAVLLINYNADGYNQALEDIKKLLN